MKQLLRPDGIMSTIFRYFKDPKFILFIDIVFSFVMVLIMILCFVALAMAEDITYDPLTSALLPNPYSTTGNMGFFPTGGPSHNTVTVAYDIDGFVAAGINATKLPGLAESSHNVAWIGSEDPLTRITVRDTIHAAEVYVRAVADDDSVARAEYNELHVTNVNSYGFYGASITLMESPLSEGHANHNLTRIVGSTFNDSYGKHLAAGVSITFSAEPLSMNIWSSGAAYANHNTLYFEDSWAQNVYGTYIQYFYTAPQGLRQDTESSYNHLVVVDSGPHSQNPVSQSVTAIGRLAGAYVIKFSQGYVQAHHNSVTVQGNTAVGEIFGTYYQMHQDDPTPLSEIEVYLGNTLNVVLPKEGGIEVSGVVANFQYFSFLFDARADSGSTGLSAGGKIYLSDAYPLKKNQVMPLAVTPQPELRQAKVLGVNLTPDGDIPADGTTYVLLASDAGIDPGDFDQTEADGSMGPFILLKFDLSLNANSLSAVLRNSRAHPQLEDPASAGNAGLAFVSQGSDLSQSGLFDPGISFLDEGAGEKAGDIAMPEPSCPRPAFAFTYGKSSYDKGASSLAINGYNMAIGVGCRITTSVGLLTVGVFGEGGKADYDTRHIPAGFPEITGDGESSYLGGGVAARLDLNPGRLGRPYVQAGARFGALETDYHTRSYEPLNGDPLSHRSRMPYRGVNLGAGLIFQTGKNAAMDVSLSYHWTRLGGDVAMTNLGEPVTFRKSDSRVAKLEARLSGNLSRSLVASVGFAGLYEFDGETRASVRGKDITPSSLKGATGSLGLGLDYVPGGDSPFRAGLSFQGYAGRRRGVEVSIHLSYSF